MPPEMPTIADVFNENGYHTAYFGKWHLDGGDYFGLGTAPEGWDPDVWYDMRNYLEELTDEERYKSRQTSTMEKEDIPEEFTFAHRCASRAVDFIRGHADEDYFLVVGFDEPHGPSLCPQPYASMYRDYDMPKRPNVYDTLENKPVHQQVWSGPRRSIARQRTRATPKPSIFWAFVVSLAGVWRRIRPGLPGCTGRRRSRGTGRGRAVWGICMPPVWA